MWTLNAPLFFLYDSNLHKYGLYSLSSISEQNLPLEPIIKHILSHSSEIIRYTGDNRWKRFLLPFWELYRTIVAMFIEAPTMTMFVIGLPASVLSIVCYCLFCLPNESAMDERQQFYRDMAEEVAQAEQMDIEPESDEQPKSLTDKKDD